jgi:hypothetical protein
MTATPFDRDDWWRRQFQHLLERESAGVEPKSLDRRYLLLASRTWGDRRWAVSFEVPHGIYHVLDDADVRSKDQVYAEGQRKMALEWLNG